MSDYTKVKASELKLDWFHDEKKKSTSCVIRHGDKIVNRGSHESMSKLFDYMNSGDPESSITIQCE